MWSSSWLSANAFLMDAGSASASTLRVLPPGESRTRYYVSIDVADRTGVLATVATVFAEHGVSIETLRQDGHGDEANLMIVTHVAREDSLAATVQTLRGLDVVRDV